MKKNIHFKIVCSLFFALLFNLMASGQNSFSSFPLLGPEYKVISIEKVPKFSVQLEIGKLFPYQNGIEVYSGGGMDSLSLKVYSEPGLFENLYESLGGEFFIGTFSEAPKFDNFKQTNGNYYGIYGAYRFNPYFETALQFATYQTQVTADFPIVIFDDETFETTSSKGYLITELKSKSIQIVGNYYPFEGIIQPFVGAGLGYTFTKASMTKAQIGEVVFDMSENPSVSSFGLVFNAGAVIMVYKNIFLQVNGKLFSVSTVNENEVAWNKVLSGGVGVWF